MTLCLAEKGKIRNISFRAGDVIIAAEAAEPSSRTK